MKRKEGRRMGAKQFRRIFLAAILFCVVLYYIMSTLLPYNGNINGEHEIAEGYFVNTSGCRMMAMNPSPMSSMFYLLKLDNKLCTKPQLFRAETFRGKNYLIRTMSMQEILNFSKVADISDISCQFKKMLRINDVQNLCVNTRIFQLSARMEQIEVEEGYNIQRIRCYNADNKTIYHDVHFFLPPPVRPVRHKKPPTPSIPDRLSVMIIGIDSISHMHYLRTMVFLDNYIKSLPHVEFWGYNRVGRNSYPNLVPLFTGLNVTELEDDGYGSTKHYDDVDFLWKHFKAAGYNTSFGEDSYIGGTFNYDKCGFDRQPTDFYLRPVMREIDRHTRYSIDQNYDIHCTASRKYSDILREFVYKVIPHIKQGPHFSFFWQSQGVHDYFHYAHFLDEDYLILLQHLKLNGILNNSLVLFMSDHGLRFGSFRSTYQGMLEESQPLLIALYPSWLEDAYPLALLNLKYNAHSLVTTFDLHATLKDLTNLRLLHDENIKRRSEALHGLGSNIPRGISLFIPIPEVRNCELAGIPSSFCLCHSLSQINPKDERSERAARFVVRSINAIIGNEKLCQRLQLKEVQVAYLLNRNDDHYEFEVKVRIVTLPGNGQFEGTTRFTGSSLALNGAVIRTNKYGNQSYCVQNYHIEMYCYC